MYDQANLKKLPRLGAGAGFVTFDAAALAEGALSKKHKERRGGGSRHTVPVLHRRACRYCPQVRGNRRRARGGALTHATHFVTD